MIWQRGSCCCSLHEWFQGSKLVSWTKSARISRIHGGLLQHLPDLAEPVLDCRASLSLPVAGLPSSRGSKLSACCPRRGLPAVTTAALLPMLCCRMLLCNIRVFSTCMKPLLMTKLGENLKYMSLRLC